MEVRWWLHENDNRTKLDEMGALIAINNYNIYLFRFVLLFLSLLLLDFVVVVAIVNAKVKANKTMANVVVAAAWIS